MATVKPTTSKPKAKHLVLPKPKGSWPEPYRVEGEAVFAGDAVTHPERGPGRFGHADWVDLEGNWVSPKLTAAGSRRDTTRGHWRAHVVLEHGEYVCPVDELRWAT